MATTIPCKIQFPFRLPRPLNPTKPPASKTARPANCELVVGRADPSTYPPLLSLKSAAATRPNLHSLNSWPAVQCNEGFCNASEGQRLPLTTTMASQKPHHSANQAFPEPWSSSSCLALTNSTRRQVGTCSSFRRSYCSIVFMSKAAYRGSLSARLTSVLKYAWRLLIRRCLPPSLTRTTSFNSCCSSVLPFFDFLGRPLG
jgi:hypothetical protein